MSNYIYQFRQTIESAGLTPPAEIYDDGKLHRFSTNGKRGDDSGWYVLHSDGIPSGSFGCWRSGFQSAWCATNEHDLTGAERQAMLERAQAMKRQREQERAQRQNKARETAAAWLAQSAPATQHPYLTAKSIKPYGARLHGDRLLIPMQDTGGILHSVQIIAPNGEKLFLSRGRVEGCYFSIGKPDGLLIVCEGFATGASIHEATGHAIAVAFNAGNLQPVAAALHAKFPTLNIMIASDDDHRTDGNPGLTKARAAALAVSGLLAVPIFPAGRPEKATDFNDLHQFSGAEAVRRCIEAAQRPSAILATDAWPAPTSLPDSLSPVQPFDSDLLPLALRGWVMDIALRMQCPPDFPAVGAIVAVSSLIGARAVVQPKAKDDWHVVPNLWGLIVGRPGVMKSPALGESLKPLHLLQTQEFEQWQAAHEAWAIDAKLRELQNADNEKKAKGLASKDPVAARALLRPLDALEEPVARRFIVNDATVEKLGELLQANPWGTLSYRDEIYGLLTGMDKQGQEGARAFYLQAYDGNQGYTFDRIGRGTVHIPRVCLAMIGGIQPGRVQEYVRGAVAGNSTDDGLLQRFGLAVWPDVNGEFRHVDQWPNSDAKQAAWAVFERLAALQPASDTEPRIWRFDAAAQALFVEWRIPFEQELKSGELHPAMESHLSKYRKLIPALALVFALIDTPDSGVIGERELIRALAWGDYLRSHANRLYSAATIPETTGAASLLKRIRSGALGTEFTPRMAALKGWAGLNTPDAVRKAADVLVDYDWLRRDVQQTGGRPSERYQVNPAAWMKEAA
jgi:putative DNA primase/helicase